MQSGDPMRQCTGACPALSNPLERGTSLRSRKFHMCDRQLIAESLLAKPLGKIWR